MDYTSCKTNGDIIKPKDDEAIEEARRRGVLGKAVIARYDRKTATGMLHQTIGKGFEDDFIATIILEDMADAGHRGQDNLDERPRTSHLRCWGRSGKDGSWINIIYCSTSRITCVKL